MIEVVIAYLNKTPKSAYIMMQVVDTMMSSGSSRGEKQSGKFTKDLYPS